MDKIKCPKCKAVWPNTVEYCICGQKLVDPIEFFEEILGINLREKDKDNAKRMP